MCAEKKNRLDKKGNTKKKMKRKNETLKMKKEKKKQDKKKIEKNRVKIKTSIKVCLPLTFGNSSYLLMEDWE